MAVKGGTHICTDKTEVETDSEGVCPKCGTVCLTSTPEEVAAMKKAYEDNGGTWGPNPTGGEK